MIMTAKGGLKTRELENDICDMIMTNGLREGEPISSENQLVDLFGVSRVTVRQALANLVERDVLYKVKGKGTFVSNIRNLLKNQRQPTETKLFALVMSAITNSYFANIAKGIEDVARDEGYHIMFCSSDMIPAKEEPILRDLLKRQVDGVFFSPGESFPLPPVINQLCLAIKNIVILDNPISGSDFNSVSCDDCEGGYLATKHLLDLGHKRIAHIKGPTKVMNAFERYQGYVKALAEAGIALDDKLVKSNETYAYERGKSNMIDWLRLAKNKRPTAIFAANDSMALGAYDAIVEAGFCVPQDFSIIGYGDLATPKERGIALTTVQQNPYLIGKRACRVLLDQINARKRTEKLLLKPELLIKETCREVKS